MIISKPGPVTDRILLLGREESCVYLLDGGEEYALLGGGLVYIIPDVLSQLEEFRIDERKINRMIVHHTHFDHVGIVPYFRKRWPWVKVTASARGKAQLVRSKVYQGILALNEVLLAERGMAGRSAEFGFDGDGIEVDETTADGDVLACGDRSLHIIETPGHSSCSMSVYVPEEKALFASDAGGIPFGDRILASANSNFDLYQQSLDKMAELDVEVHLAEHYGAHTGEDGRGYMKRSIESAKETRAEIEKLFARTQDERETVDQITKWLVDQASDYFLPREIMAMVVGQMTRFIAGKLGAGQRDAPEASNYNDRPANR